MKTNCKLCGCYEDENIIECSKAWTGDINYDVECLYNHITDEYRVTIVDNGKIILNHKTKGYENGQQAMCLFLKCGLKMIDKEEKTNEK